MYQRNPSIDVMTEVVNLLRKEDRLTLLIKFSSTIEQAVADVFEDYLSLLEECDFLRGERDRLQYDQEQLRQNVSQLEHELDKAHQEQRHRVEDLESQVHRLERDNRNYRYRSGNDRRI